MSRNKRAIKGNHEEKGTSDIHLDTAETFITVVKKLVSAPSFWSRCLCSCSVVSNSGVQCPDFTLAALVPGMLAGLLRD